MQEYGGSLQNVPLGQGYSIVKNGASAAQASALAVGDRVEVKKNAEGAVVISVNSGVVKSFWKLDTAQVSC